MKQSFKTKTNLMSNKYISLMKGNKIKERSLPRRKKVEAARTINDNNNSLTIMEFKEIWRHLYFTICKKIRITHLELHQANLCHQEMINLEHHL